MGLYQSKQSYVTELSINENKVTQNNLNLDAIEEFVDLDELSLDELINYIQNKKFKKLDIPDNFTELIKDVKLDNIGLIPLVIEFYNKVSKLITDVPAQNNYKQKINVSKFNRYIKPTFGPTTVIENKNSIIKNMKINENLNIQLNLDNVQKPITIFNHCKIDIVEFTDCFSEIISKIDMLGISKKMLLDMPLYHKIRIINNYNKIIDGEYDDNICFGRASYMYKNSKNGPKDDIDSFREIIMIPTVINHFHRIFAKRLEKYLKVNNYIDFDIQKGAVSGIKYPCLEQIIKVKEIVKDANKNKKSACLLFLDITNAFGSLNRKRLFEIMEKYYIDIKFIDYVRYYYDNFRYYATAGIGEKSWSTPLMNFNEGLVQGCPLSPILFVLAMNYILKYLNAQYMKEYGYELNNEQHILFTAYMDDICIITKNMQSLELIYNKIKFLLDCLGMKLNQQKSVIMQINCNVNTFDNIPIKNNIKYLGEYITNDGTIAESFETFLTDLKKKLLIIHKKKIGNEVKLSFFSKLMLPWIQRKMLVMYDLDMNNRLKLITIIKKYIRLWNFKDHIKIFSFLTDIVSSSTDTILNKIKFDEIYDKNLINNIDLANCIINDSNIDFSYGTINKSPDVTILDNNELDIAIQQI